MKKTIEQMAFLVKVGYFRKNCRGVELIGRFNALDEARAAANNYEKKLYGEDYSREELVAEIGSAMTCNVLGIDNAKAFRNSVAYIKAWIKELKNDARAIVWAASRAEAASKYIIN